MLGQMRQTIFEDPKLSLFQQAINDQFGKLIQIPFINGNLIGSVSISGTVTVNHGLGRTAQGYFVTSNSAGVAVGNSAFSGTISISLFAASPTVVDLWVF